MVNENSRVSYFNTLIFTIISGIISLLLLLALFFEVGKKNAYLIIMVEIGIFTIIALCIYKIIINEKRLSKDKKQIYNKLSFQSCPDYFEKSIENDVTYCKNNFVITNADNTQKKILIYPLAATLPKPSYPLNNSSSNPITFKFPLYNVEKSDKFKSANDECAIIMKEPPPNVVALQEFKDYSKLPWSYARSRCEPYVE